MLLFVVVVLFLIRVFWEVINICLTYASDAATVSEFYYALQPKESTVILNDSDSLELLCKVDSYPSSTINITRSGILLQHRKHSYQTVYRISQVTCSDSGTYDCMAKNEEIRSYSISSKSLQVFVTCKIVFDYDNSITDCHLHSIESPL